jgi:hypothetical protein
VEGRCSDREGMGVQLLLIGICAVRRYSSSHLLNHRLKWCYNVEAEVEKFGV